MNVPLSENIGTYDAGNYYVTAAIWRTSIQGHLVDTFEIGVHSKLDQTFTLLQSERYDYQSVQEVANVVAMLLADKSQSYTPSWCAKFLT